MLKKHVRKIVYIKKLNLALIYYLNGKIEKMSPCPGLIDQARIENILQEEEG